MGDSFISLNIFPWIDRLEFKKIFQELYSKRKSLQKHAVGRIEVWKTRVPKLPVAVDVTADLVRCLILNVPEDADSGVRTQALAFMVMKFVNNLTEEKQQKFKKQKILDIANEMGIPRSLVNLRHQIAHGKMPSTLELEAGVKMSLNWLKVNFWEIQVKEPHIPEDPINQRLEILRNFLDQYQNEGHEVLSEDGYPINNKLLGQIEQSMFGLGDKGCSVLLDDGYLLCTEKQLNNLSLTSEDIFHQSTGLPPSLYTFWQPVLTVIDDLGLLSSLLLQMVSVLTPDTSYRNRLLYGWIHTILVNKPSWTSALPCKQLLEIAAQVTTPFGKPTLLLLVDMVDDRLLCKDKKAVLVHELEQFYSKLDEEANENSETDNEDKVIEDPPAKEKRIWTKCVEQVHWSSIPIGLLPNQNLSFKNLELDWSEMDEEEELQEDDQDLTTVETEMVENKLKTDRHSNEMQSCVMVNGVHTETEQLWSEENCQQILNEIVLF